jgi:hypothetical protein
MRFPGSSLAFLTATALLSACISDQTTAPPRTAEPGVASAAKLEDAPVVVSVEHFPMLPNDVSATIGVVSVFNGGFGSAIDKPEGGNTDFYSMTDRGPNVSGSGSDKLFAVPGFHPQIGRFHLENGALIRQEVIVLKDAFGNLKSGLPINPASCGGTGENPKDLNGNQLAFDPNGIDSEGLRVMGDGTFWVSDEYGPFLTHFDRNGLTIEQNSPCSGPNKLPAVLVRRQANKGMEGLASVLGGTILVGMIQNPLDNPNHDAGKNSHLLRIVWVDVRNHTTKQFLYPMDDKGFGVSEIEAVSPTQFIVDERDGKFINDAVGGASVEKKIYLIDVSGATDVSDPADGASGLVINGKTIEQMSDQDLANNNIKPVTKTFIANLLQWGYPHDKAEGLVLLDGGWTIGVSNDDDFGVTDDGHAHLIQKLLPSTGLVDHNELWLFHLSRNLKSIH